ncbi:MAG: hypothetical protein OEM52_14540, partial [bacterium]|nr:hypothetical protein [bacterium]
YGASDRGYHSTSPFVFGEALRRHALVILNEMGIPVKYGHSEVGYIEACEEDPYVWEQHEIELALQPLPQAAENVVITQWVLRNLAHLSGMQCSFAPVVRKGHAGSGMHFHLSPVRNGEHLTVNDETGNLRKESKWLIGGLVQMGGVLMAFGNRDKTSFLRLSQAKEAPNAVTWGRFNRKALIRLPIVATDAEGNAVTHETIEYRLPDGSAHPQLLLAGIAQAMLLGKNTPNLDEWISRTAAEAVTDGNGKIAVPKSFAEVAEILIANAKVFTDGNVFPEHIIQRWSENLQS